MGELMPKIGNVGETPENAFLFEHIILFQKIIWGDLALKRLYLYPDRCSRSASLLSEQGLF